MVDVQETPSTPASETAYIKVTRVNPGKQEDDSMVEGLRLRLDNDGKLDLNLLTGFVVDMSVCAMEASRTLVLTTRLINNYIIVETVTLPPQEPFNKEMMIEEAKAKMLMKLVEHLRFLWCSATANAKQLSADLEAEHQELEQLTTSQE